MSGLSNTLIKSLREYLLDQEELNQLNLNEVELTDPILKGAVEDGIRAYDLILPLSNTNSETLTVDSDAWYYIKKLAAVEALERLVFMHIRNSNPVNDNGFQVDEYGKARDWKTVKDSLFMDIVRKIESYKRTLHFMSFVPTTVSFQDG